MKKIPIARIPLTSISPSNIVVKPVLDVYIVCGFDLQGEFKIKVETKQVWVNYEVTFNPYRTVTSLDVAKYIKPKVDISFEASVEMNAKIGAGAGLALYFPAFRTLDKNGHYKSSNIGAYAEVFVNGKAKATGNYPLYNSEEGLLNNSAWGRIDLSAGLFLKPYLEGNCNFFRKEYTFGWEPEKPIAILNQDLSKTWGWYYMSEGTEKKLKIAYGSGVYNTKSSNPKVAYAIISGDKVTIKAQKEGETKITIDDPVSWYKKTDLTVNVKKAQNKGLALSVQELNMKVGETAVIEITEGVATGAMVNRYAVADVTLSKDGKKVTVKALEPGEVSLTVYNKTERVSIPLKVVSKEGVLRIEPNTLNLSVGQTATAKVIGSSEWLKLESNSNADVAKVELVNKELKVTALAKGTTTITVNNNDTEATLTVTVETSTNHAPSKPVLITPVSTTVPYGKNIEFKWQKSTDTDSDPIEYEFIFYRIKGDVQIKWIYHHKTNSYTYNEENLPAGEYKWKVVASDGKNKTASEVARFTIVKAKDLTLSTDRVSIKKGETQAVTITSGSGNYTANSENTNIATATLNGTTINITGMSQGNTEITVTDIKSNQTQKIDVIVKDGAISKLAIEYVANYDVNGSGDGLSTDHELGTAGLFTWYELTGKTDGVYNTDKTNIFENEGLKDYHLPSINEWRGVFADYNNGKNIRFDSITTTYNYPEIITVKGITKQYTADYKSNGGGIAYAIKFKEDDFLRSAYRYEMTNEEHEMIIKVIKLTDSNLTINEVSNEKFWIKNHKDIISRVFSLTGWRDYDSDNWEILSNNQSYWTSTEYPENRICMASYYRNYCVHFQFKELKKRQFAVRPFYNK